MVGFWSGVQAAMGFKRGVSLPREVASPLSRPQPKIHLIIRRSSVGSQILLSKAPTGSEGEQRPVLVNRIQLANCLHPETMLSRSMKLKRISQSLPSFFWLP
jgi:hypothetical protein